MKPTNKALRVAEPETPLHLVDAYSANPVDVVDLGGGFSFVKYAEFGPYLLHQNGKVCRLTSKYNKEGWHAAVHEGDGEVLRLMASARTLDEQQAWRPIEMRPVKEAPRDGSLVTLVGINKDGHPFFHNMVWSTGYSIHGLGGCWTEGFYTMSDFDYIGYLAPVAPPSATKTSGEG